MKNKPSQFTLAAAHVGEAIRILLSVDRKRFEELAGELRPFVQRIEELRSDE